MRDPERNLPRALILGTGAIILIYLLVNAAYLYLIPIGPMARSPLVAADAAQLLVGRTGVALVSLVVMIATFSTLLGSMLTAPRIFFAMADDGLFFRSVARVHPRFETPSVAIVLTACLGIAFVLARTFEELADQFVVAIFPFYALAAAAVFVLRRRRPDLPRPVRVWGYPAVPFLFVLASLVILGNALREHPGGTGLAFVRVGSREAFPRLTPSVIAGMLDPTCSAPSRDSGDSAHEIARTIRLRARRADHLLATARAGSGRHLRRRGGPADG